MPSPSSTLSSTPSGDVTDADLDAVRRLIAAALDDYACTRPGMRGAGGVTAAQLADNVAQWTHTTRLREFLARARAGTKSHH